MICRIWRGWTTPQNADAYESVVRAEVIPGIEALRIAGFRHIDLLRRATDQEVEFATVMWFDDLAAVRRFMGDDYEVSHVPLVARAVLARFDERSAHYDVVNVARKVAGSPAGIRLRTSEPWARMVFGQPGCSLLTWLSEDSDALCKVEVSPSFGDMKAEKSFRHQS